MLLKIKYNEYENTSHSSQVQYLWLTEESGKLELDILLTLTMEQEMQLVL